jgi:PAS domain S-box-containing protein
MNKACENEKEYAILTQAIRQVAEAIVVTDLHDHIIFVNNAFLNLYGYTREELIGKNIHFLWSQNTLPETLMMYTGLL